MDYAGVPYDHSSAIHVISGYYRHRVSVVHPRTLEAASSNLSFDAQRQLIIMSTMEVLTTSNSALMLNLNEVHRLSEQLLSKARKFNLK
jgi:hypothetical protein